MNILLRQQLRGEVRSLQEDLESLRHVNGMLKQKVAKIGERQIENERKLKVSRQFSEYGVWDYVRKFTFFSSSRVRFS